MANRYKLHRMERIFKIWPSLADMARDLGENPITVRHWRRRESIPAKFDTRIIEAAAKRGATVTYEQLAHLRAAPPAHLREAS